MIYENGYYADAFWRCIPSWDQLFEANEMIFKSHGKFKGNANNKIVISGNNR